MKVQRITIDVSKRHSTILFGNGICRCIGMDSCDGIIEQIRKENNPSADPKIMKTLQFPQKIVVATNDHVDENMKRLTYDMINCTYSDNDIVFLKEVLSNAPDVILTANYSTELETAVYEKFTQYKYNQNVAKAYDLRSTAENLGLNSYISLKTADMEKHLWHIHGNAMKPKSIVMGHYYYGKLLREIQEYVPNFIRRYKAGMKSEDHLMQIKSWIDYFMICDVHMLGFSMDPAETDLWWLLCCKKRHCPESKAYFYEPEEKYIHNTGKELLMKAYGVEIITQEGFAGNYKEFYIKSLSEIE